MIQSEYKGNGWLICRTRHVRSDSVSKEIATYSKERPSVRHVPNCFYCSQSLVVRRYYCITGEHALRPPPMDGVEPTPVTAVAISTCGNFGLVGTAGGRVDRYNMQSGIHRGDYCMCAATLNNICVTNINANLLSSPHCNWEPAWMANGG